MGESTKLIARLRHERDLVLRKAADAGALAASLQREFELHQRIAELESAMRNTIQALAQVQWVDTDTLYHCGAYRCAVCLERPSDGHAPQCRTKAALERAQKALEGGKL